MAKVKKLQALLKKKYELAIGEKTAEDLEAKINKVLASKMKISGRSYASGRKARLSVSLSELMGAFED